MKHLLTISMLAVTTMANLGLASSAGNFGQSCGGCHFPVVPLPTTSVCIENLPDDRQYDPSKPGGYPIRVLVNGIAVREDGGDPSAPMAGFSLKVSAGTLEVAPEDLNNAKVNGDKTVATHKGAGQTAWNLKWTPSDSAPTTTFTLTGIAVNGNHEADPGDVWNSQSFQFTASNDPSSTPGQTCSAPAIPAPIYVPDVAP